MTTPPNIPRRAKRYLPALAVVTLVTLGWATACSTIESTTFGNGMNGCVAGGCGQATTSASSGASSSSSSGSMCFPDAGCAVSWKMDIFAGMLDINPGGCTAVNGLCHGDGKGNLTLTAGDAAGAYTALTGWHIVKPPETGKPYIVPCDPMASGMLCNMAQDATNPFGDCGKEMPLVGTNLTPAQLTKIADWITCGAPNN